MIYPKELFAMDSYVVRIYRRETHKPQDVAGLVEIVAKEEERPFANFEELRAILCKAGKSLSTKSGARAPKK
jgi:hypothetical protein